MSRKVRTVSDHKPQDSREQYFKDWAVAAVANPSAEGNQRFAEAFYATYPNRCLGTFIIQACKEARLKEATNE